MRDAGRSSGSIPLFLQGPGEMAARMRAFDWSASPLGPPGSWPHGVEIGVGPDPEGAVVVEVRDHGAGIPADKLEEVVEMFVQPGGALDRTRSGLGLGLPLARRIVEMHGGTVVARSEGRGLGPRFVVRLPGARAGGLVPSPAHAPGSKGSAPASPG